eukprot:5265030-Ditylum_brightwellii.AAC.1
MGDARSILFTQVEQRTKSKTNTEQEFLAIVVLKCVTYHYSNHQLMIAVVSCIANNFGNTAVGDKMPSKSKSNSNS